MTGYDWILCRENDIIQAWATVARCIAIKRMEILISESGEW